MSVPIEMGGEYRDEYTGFIGRVIARSQYLSGYNMVLMVRADATGKPEEVWVPENRLETGPAHRPVGIKPFVPPTDLVPVNPRHRPAGGLREGDEIVIPGDGHCRILQVDWPDGTWRIEFTVALLGIDPQESRRLSRFEEETVVMAP